MNAFIVLFVLLATVAGAYSREDLLGRNLSIYENLSEDEINEVSVQIETEFIKMKSIECRRDDQVPEEFKQNCTDFLKNFELLFYNCFCHKDERILGDYRCHCCEDRPVVNDLVFALYENGELRGFDQWLMERSYEAIDGGVGNCEIMRMSDDFWYNSPIKVDENGSGWMKVEHVRFDGEQDKEGTLFNCDYEQEAFATLACDVSRAENSNVVDSFNDEHYHLGTVEQFE